MNALLLLLALALGVGVSTMIPDQGPAAALFCAGLAVLTLPLIGRTDDRVFLRRVFAAALLLRVALGAVINFFDLHGFFGPDAFTYDAFGDAVLKSWQGDYSGNYILSFIGGTNWGMSYIVAVIYAVTGRNMLAVQFFNAVAGAATAPLVYLCADHIFVNKSVARLSALFCAFFPSLVLWSSFGLKDAPIVFLLALIMLATLRLGERVRAGYVALLASALAGVMSFRFYIFYMVAASIAGAFLIGTRAHSTTSLLRQCLMIVGVGLALTYLGVSRSANEQIDQFASLQAVQAVRQGHAYGAGSAYGQDVDVSTTSGALSALPSGVVVFLFAPFPWQITNLRQSITLPEMALWWASVPLLVLGLWYTLKFRLRPALPVLLFSAMTTLAYALTQGNVGTAYRMRAQLLVFYFIFVAVGGVLLIERREDQRRTAAANKEAARRSGLRGGRGE